MSPEELQLKRAELAQEKDLRLQSHKLAARDLKLRTLTNPLLIVAITVAAGIYGHHLIAEHNKFKAVLAQKRFCYDVLSDLIIKNSARRREAAEELGRLITFNLIADCEGDLREFADYYSRNPMPVVESAPPSETCEKISSIRELGWTSGHKTRFCKALSYDGVHNPFGNYSAGGFCYKGDHQACISEIQKRK